MQNNTILFKDTYIYSGGINMKRINTQIRIVVILRKGVEDQGCDSLGIKGCLCNVVFFFFFSLCGVMKTQCVLCYSLYLLVQLSYFLSFAFL